MQMRRIGTQGMRRARRKTQEDVELKCEAEIREIHSCKKERIDVSNLGLCTKACLILAMSSLRGLPSEGTAFCITHLI
jgi:hypothetical protein